MAAKIVYGTCKVCGGRAREGALAAHPTTNACKTQQVNARYEARGWTQVNATYAVILREAGVPCEDAPAGIHQTEVAVGAEEKGSFRKLKTRWVEGVHDVTFAPRPALRVLIALKNLPSTVNKDFRRRAVGALWQEGEHILAAIDTVKRLGGNAPSYIWKMIVTAEEEGRAAETGCG